MESLTAQLAEMQGTKVYVDTNIIIYILDDIKEFSPVCLPFFKAIEEGEITGCSGDLTLAELLVKPMQKNDLTSIEIIKSLFDEENGFFEVLPHDRRTFELAAHIRATQGLKMVDAIHTATAIKNNCQYILTNDKPLARHVSGIKSVNISDYLR